MENPLDKPVTIWTIRAYKTRTVTVVTLLVTLGFLFGFGFGGLVVYLLLGRYLRRRDQGVALLYSRLKESLENQILRKSEEIKQIYNSYIYQEICELTFAPGKGLSQVRMCHTCSNVMLWNLWEQNPQCPSLPDVFPHKVQDDPPPSNPFQWLWLKWNGYRLPPSDWPSDKPYLPPGCITFDPAELVADGIVYYSQHPNFLWDAGFGNIPEWYKEQPKVA